MDGLDAFLLFFFFFIIMSSCCYCCSSKRQGTVLSAPVQVTSAACAAPSGYRVMHIRPTATGYQTQTYSTPYPPQAIPSIRMPMPMFSPETQPNATQPIDIQQIATQPIDIQQIATQPIAAQQIATQPPPPGIRSDVAPTPAISATSLNPPPYHLVVAGSDTGETSRTIYEKQLPYNPNFQK